jgi:hypothetical protein
MSKAPLQCVCAAKDRGIQTTKKSGLLWCVGKHPVPFEGVPEDGMLPHSSSFRFPFNILSTDSEAPENTERASLLKDTSLGTFKGRVQSITSTCSRGREDHSSFLRDARVADVDDERTPQGGRGTRVTHLELLYSPPMLVRPSTGV